MKARILNFKCGESHYPFRTKIKDLEADAIEQAYRRILDGATHAIGLHIGDNTDSRTEINDYIDLTRPGTQFTHSSGPSVEIVNPATLDDLRGVLTHYSNARMGAAAEEAANNAD